MSYYNREFAPFGIPVAMKPGSLRLGTGGLINLPLSVGLLSNFTDITSITIDVREWSYALRNLYAAVLSHLSTLLFYDDVEHIEFRCHSKEEWWPGHYGDELDDTQSISSLFGPESPSPIDGPSPRGSEYNTSGSDIYRFGSCESDTSDLEYTYPQLEYLEDDRRREFLSHLRERPWKGSDFLGRYVSKTALGKLVATQRLRFPRGLKYLKLDMETYEEYTCLPLVSCREITALHIGQREFQITIDPRRPDEIVKLSGINALEVSVHYRTSDATLTGLYTQFPNLKILVLISPIFSTSWINRLPNFPQLEYLQVPFSSSDGEQGEISIGTMQQQIMERLVRGDFPALKKLKVYGDRIVADNFACYGEATCMISSFIDSQGENKRWKFEWIEDLREIEKPDPEKTELDRLWSSGRLFEDIGEVDGDMGGADHVELDILQLDSDESIYDSEEERIDIARRQKIQDAKRERARRRREWILEERRRWDKLDDQDRNSETSGSYESEREPPSEEEEEGGREYQPEREEEGKEEVIPQEYGYVNFENVANGIDVASDTSSIAGAANPGEEEEDEIGHTASQYLSLSLLDDTINPEDSDEYEDMENATQETLDGSQDPPLDVFPNNSRYQQEELQDNTQYGSQDSQFDTQEYLANAARMAQEPYPKPENAASLTLDPKEVEKIRHKNLYRR
ncbi:hypothetical protein TWF718_003396 [Orbilia javanica]|uniref:Uncharacterized protein n=1 Tax=Orbilia javanica TaxID=47235 RepID=A0AAN8RJ11_9PEZI